jgi:hypothetical protein
VFNIRDLFTKGLKARKIIRKTTRHRS